MARKPLTEEQRERKRERDRASSLLWRTNNPEKARAKNAKFRADHPDVFRDYYAAHRDQCIAASVAYDKAHPEYARERSRKLYYSRKARGKSLRSNDKDAARLRGAKRRALEHSSSEDFPPNFIPDLLEKQRGMCAGCRAQIRKKYHADHVTPLARGGKHAPNNIQLLCPPCNLTKHAKDPIEWRQSLGQLI